MDSKKTFPSVGFSSTRRSFRSVVLPAPECPTTETNSFFFYFWDKLKKLGTDPGRHFVAITDPGTPLETLAKERNFRGTFNAPAEVGGRYSALTMFGLVPAALIGVDIGAVLARARRMSKACGAAHADGGMQAPGREGPWRLTRGRRSRTAPSPPVLRVPTHQA